MLKLHCDKCHAFMEEVTPSQAAHLKGDEVCKSCVARSRETLKNLKAAYTTHQNKLGATYNKAVHALEEIIHKELSL